MLKKRKIFISLLTIIFLLIATYCIAVFSNIPFIEKWRTIYIETAMTTMSHKWLATSFIPSSVIDEVMSNAEEQQIVQESLESTWSDIPNSVKQDIIKEEIINNEEKIDVKEEFVEPIPSAKDIFFDNFWEIDKNSFENLIKKYPEFLKHGYENILIENLDFKYDIKTIFNERIKVLDVKNNLIIIEVTGEQYSGLLAKSKNPEQITIAKSTTLGSYGNLIKKFSQDNNALVAINASGFMDENWKGNGGIVTGSLVLDGHDYGNPLSSLKFFGFKNDNRLYIENYDPNNVKNYKWAIQFSPALIVDGEVFVQGSFGYGLQPRSAVGQTIDGEFLMLIIDGRQVGHSIGATVGDLSEIMLRHKTYQAMNLDGGSSSIMTYKNETINRPSSKTNAGRYLPSAFIMKYAKEE